jgi:hypothetical protein
MYFNMERDQNGCTGNNSKRKPYFACFICCHTKDFQVFLRRQGGQQQKKENRLSYIVLKLTTYRCDVVILCIHNVPCSNLGSESDYPD